MITINLNDATDAWWEANKHKDWREQMAARSAWSRTNTYVNPKMSFVEMAIEATGQIVTFDRFDDEGNWDKLVFKFNNEYLDLDNLKALMDVEIIHDGKKFVFHSVESFVHEEHDRGYGGEMISSSYPRISVIFKAN